MYSASGGVLIGSGSDSVRTLSVSSAGEVTVTVSAPPNPDGISDSRTLTATAEADSYTLGWVLRLSSNTVFASFGGSAVTIIRLRYASGYMWR